MRMLDWTFLPLAIKIKCNALAIKIKCNALAIKIKCNALAIKIKCNALNFDSVSRAIPPSSWYRECMHDWGGHHGSTQGSHPLLLNCSASGYSPSDWES